MSLSCVQIDPKLGLKLTYPALELKHSYLEHLLKLENRLDRAQFWTGKLYEGVTSEDLDRLEREGKSIIFASGRTAYFADPATAEFIARRIYRHPSDAVAYGSLPVSAAQASTVMSDRRAKLLVIDDENGRELPPIELGNPTTIEAIARKLGDCYMLISPELAASVQAEANTPFQFRAATSDWYGMIKGTCRVSQGCTALGVDAIVPLSGTKGHGKTVQPGLYEVDNFFLSRKSNAQLREQKLGIQALVNLPEGMVSEIIPRLQQEAERLSEIAQDPRQISKLYVQSTERRQRRVQDLDEAAEVLTETSKIDWLSELLKGDPSYQLLQHDRVQERLQKFLSGEWQDIATGGVYVPQALAQPHRMLKTGEVCVPSMLHGERIALYRSPVANIAAFDVFTNNITKLQQEDPEAFAQQGVAYLNPDDAKRLVIDFDGDTVALIRGQEYPVLVQEIQEKNRPGQKPIQVEKEAKIPRSWYPGQTYSQALSIAAIDAANNQVGMVANLGMTIESLRHEISYLPAEQKVAYLKQVVVHWQELLNAAVDRKLGIPTDYELQESGFAAYDFANQILKVVQTARTISNQTPEQQQQTAAACLKQVQQIMFETQSLVAVNLQRAVDAPKSARPINAGYQKFAKTLVAYKPHEVIQNKKAANLYRGSKVIPSNTCDPVGLMVQQANQYFGQAQLPVQERKHFKTLFPDPEGPALPAVQEFTERYNRLIRQATQDLEQNQQQIEPRLLVTSRTSGRQLEISEVLKLNPEMDAPIWHVLRTGEPLDVVIVPSKAVSKPVGAEYVAKLRLNEHPIGFVSRGSLEQQGIYLSSEQRLTIAQANFSIRLSDKDIAEEGFKQANRFLEQFVATVPVRERAQVAAYLWHNGGQAACLKAFPHEILNQIQTQTMKLSAIGLQYLNETGKVWKGETVLVRTALDNDPNSRNYNRAMLQVQVENAWKTLGIISGEGMAQLPIGTQAQATIYSEIAQVKTSRGNVLSVRNIESYDLAGQEWQATAAQIRFHSEGTRIIASIAQGEEWKRLGNLEQKSITNLRRIEQRWQPIIDSHHTLKNAVVNAVPGSSAAVMLHRETIQYPEQWIAPPQNLSAPQPQNLPTLLKPIQQLPLPAPHPAPQPQPTIPTPQPEIADPELGRKTAIAAIALLKNHSPQADGSKVMEGKLWRIRQWDNNLSIIDKADGRVILEVEESRLRRYAPLPDDQDKLAWMRSRYGQVEQQQSRPQQRLSC